MTDYENCGENNRQPDNETQKTKDLNTQDVIRGSGRGKHGETAETHDPNEATGK